MTTETLESRRLLEQIITVLAGHLGSGRCWIPQSELDSAPVHLLKIRSDARNGGVWVDTTITVVDSPTEC
jgi:hypothetical protein